MTVFTHLIAYTCVLFHSGPSWAVRSPDLARTTKTFFFFLVYVSPKHWLGPIYPIDDPSLIWNSNSVRCPVFYLVIHSVTQCWVKPQRMSPCSGDGSYIRHFLSTSHGPGPGSTAVTKVAWALQTSGPSHSHFAMYRIQIIVLCIKLTQRTVCVLSRTVVSDFLRSHEL